MSCKRNFSLMDASVLMKLHTVVVYNLRMCMKEDNPGPTYFNGDHSFCGTSDLTHSSCFKYSLMVSHCISFRLISVIKSSIT